MYYMLAVTLPLLCCLLGAAPVRSLRPTPDKDESLIGWLGDSYDQGLVFGEFDPDRKTPYVVQISESPKAFVYYNFLSDAEVDHILETAAPQMKRSSVVGKDGNGAIDNIRTSYGMFLPRMRDDTIAKIEQRIAAWSNTTVVQQEDMQVLRYVDGQKYGAHMDGLGRLATCLMYLNEPDFGGETIFPKGKWLDPALADGFTEVSPCAEGHVGFKPQRGAALLFYDQLPDGTADVAATHSACPVIRGTKWSAPVWIHPEPWRPDSLKASLKQPPRTPPDPGFCEDTDKRCTAWAAAGECTNNPTFMTGEGSAAQGACRRACAACEACPSSSLPCYHANRERAGFLNLFDEIRTLTAH
eukprot:jgi/Ulvmu1/77/UM001_0080.1